MNVVLFGWALASLGAALGAGVPAQTHDDLVGQLLADADQIVLHAEVVLDRRLRLSEGESETLGLVAGGPAYVAVAVCDAGCLDVDLGVTDGQGQPLGGDYAPDNVPMVEFDGRGPYPHMVEVTMANCSTGECEVGVRVYRRP